MMTESAIVPSTKHKAEPEFTSYNNIASQKIGGQVLFSTDDWFATAENLLKDATPEYREGYYTDCGKWMDGWETRRKRDEGYNWCIIQLGVGGCIHGVDVDTSYFTGNFAPRCSIQAACLDKTYKCREGDRLGKAATEADYNLAEQLKSEEWEHIVALTQLKPGYRTSCHNYFQCNNTEKRFTHIRLNIYPDGGIARLRVYGQAQPNWSALSDRKVVDLLSVMNGGVCLGCSQASYGHSRNLIQAGRADTMAEGWEISPRDTRPTVVQRNRHGYLHNPASEWCMFRLGHPGIVKMVEIDTNHFKGNFPDTCKVEACYIDKEQEQLLHDEGHLWKTLLPVTKLKAHNQHFIDTSKLDNVGVISHVRLTIAPDGGVSRFRIWGTKAVQPTSRL